MAPNVWYSPRRRGVRTRFAVQLATWALAALSLYLGAYSAFSFRGKRDSTTSSIATSCAHEEPLLAAAVRVGNACGPEGEGFVRLVVEKVDGTEGTYVAVRDRQYKWWGDFVCFEFLNGRLLGQAGPDVIPEEQSIYSARGVTLQGFGSPFVEVIGNTHMGHGDYYLYKLSGRDLRLVLKTFALDCHQDGNLIKGPHLTALYKDLDGDGLSDVEFTGIIEEWTREDWDGPPSRSFPCRKVFYWSPSMDRFQEDPSARVGFEIYSNRP